MLTKRVIPCLDVTGGRVVKGTRFLALRDAGDPVECALAYNDQGADELVFLDITASSDDRRTMIDVVRAHRRPVFHAVDGRRRGAHGGRCARAAPRRGRQGERQHGGAGPAPGDRRVRARLRLAVRGPGRGRQAGAGGPGGRTARCAGRFTPTEAANRRAATCSTGCARRRTRGAGEILLTSMDADGTKDGYDIKLTAAVSAAVEVPVIASGGAGRLEHSGRRAHARPRGRRAGREHLPFRRARHYFSKAVSRCARHSCAAPRVGTALRAGPSIGREVCRSATENMPKDRLGDAVPTR